jgi:transcriptional regulator with XRE-family HTH domain
MEQLTRRAPVFTLGDRLRKSREVLGMTQQQFAGHLGIGRRSVSRYEDDLQVPIPAVLMAWAMATGVPYEWLVDDDELPASAPISECYPLAA